MRLMRVLVIGGLGDVGPSVLRELVRGGHRIRSFDRRSIANLLAAGRLRGLGIEFTWGDVRSPDDVRRAVEHQDAVLHMAAIIPPRSELYPIEARAVNVEGTRNVVQALEVGNGARLIYVSSLAVFGRTSDRPPPRSIDEPVQPFDEYTRHKVEAEDLVRSSGLAWSILRLAAVVPRGWLRSDLRLLMGEMFEVPLAQRIECVHASDVAVALSRAITSDDVLGRTLLIGGGPSCQVVQRDFVQRTLDALGIGALPESAFGSTPYHTDWLDTTESQRLLAYQQVSFAEYLAEIPRGMGRWRSIVRVLRPLLRWLILRQSPYLDHRTVPWGALSGALGGAIILAALSMWGGSAQPGPLLWLGVALMSGSLAVFAVVAWWLYLSPVSGSVSDAPVGVAPGLVQRVALLAALGGLGTQVAAFWDDAWHRRFGGFGDDFLWPPHLLIYLSLGFIAVCGVGSLMLTLRGGEDPRLRFRAAPAVGLLGLVAAFMVVLLPSDEVWHRLYGLDITAWSPPHLLAGVNFSLVLLAAATAQLSLLPPSEWRLLERFTLREAIAVAALGLGTLELLQIGVTEWDGQDVLRRTAGGGFAAAFQGRPEWVYPVVLVTIATFVGQLTIHSLRRAGVATLLASGVLGVRVVGLAVLDAWHPAIGMSFISHLLLVPPMLALDVWYATRLRQGQSTVTLLGANLLAAAAFVVPAVPAIASSMASPRVNGETLPAMLVMSLVMAMAAGTAGARLGAWLATWRAGSYLFSSHSGTTAPSMTRDNGRRGQRQPQFSPMQRLPEEV
jgi:nucleoside-diphosphate-sugar epimerase